MRERINKIKLDAFKGATKPFELTFDHTKPVTLIFGENGTGKSTISDAIDFICNKSLGSLDDRRLGNTKHQHLPSINQTQTELRVTLSTSTREYTGTLSGRDISIHP